MKPAMPFPVLQNSGKNCNTYFQRTNNLTAAEIFNQYYVKIIQQKSNQ